MKTKAEDIKRIIASKKARLEALAQPGMWIRYTKNMECGEIREFKQSCIDDEIIIEALERLTPKKPIARDLWELGTAMGSSCPTCGYDFPIGNYKRYEHCPECGQALDYTYNPNEKGGK